MNWKLIIGGALVFFIATWIVGMVTGMVIHNGVLMEPYKETSEFWRPELRSDPPDMAALMPLWILNGLIGALVIACIYGWVRRCLEGPGWKKGAKYGLMLWLLAAALYLGLSGVFDLPGTIWAWWAVDALIIYCLGGLALGWFAERWVPAT